MFKLSRETIEGLTMTGIFYNNIIVVLKCFVKMWNYIFLLIVNSCGRQQVPTMELKLCLVNTLTRTHWRIFLGNKNHMGVTVKIEPSVTLCTTQHHCVYKEPWLKTPYGGTADETAPKQI